VGTRTHYASHVSFQTKFRHQSLDNSNAKENVCSGNKECKKLSAETKFSTLQCILARLYFPLLLILLPVCVG